MNHALRSLNCWIFGFARKTITDFAQSQAGAPSLQTAISLHQLNDVLLKKSTNIW